MNLLTLALSRAVPLLLLASASLVLARLVHDLVSRKSPAMGLAAFAAVLGLGVAALAPFSLRASCVVRGSAAFEHARWSAASRAFSDLEAAGGKLGPRLGYEYGAALMNQRRFAEAERVLLGTVERRPGARTVAVSPRTVIALGVCRYHARRLDAAEKTFAAVQAPELAYLRSYFLGRIAELRGDRAAALRGYDAALSGLPAFLPAAFQLVRLRLAEGDGGGAAAALARVPPRAFERDEGFRALAAHVESRTAPEAREFFVVFED